MKTRVEDISSIKKKLLIEIESQEVDNKLDDAYKKLSKKAKIPGFRPGKTPRKMLEMHFGNQVVEDVTRDLINETLPKAIQEVETFPLGPPLLEKNALKQGNIFTYSAMIEVLPQFELKNYLKLEAEKEKYSITKEDVQNQLDQIRKNHGKLTSIDHNRPIKKDDYVILDYEGFEEGRPIDGIKSSNFLLNVGSNDFHHDFEEPLIGLKKDSETEINVEFEDNYYHSKLAGRNINFKVKIIDIKEMILPELNDEFAQNIGANFKDLKDMKNKVKKTVVAEEKKRIDKELKQRLLQKISESVDFELPQVLVETEINSAVENIKQNLTRSGSNLEKMGLSEEKIRNDFRPVSEKRVKEMLILNMIAKQDEITVGEEDIEKAFNELASTTGENSKNLRKYYEERNVLDSLREKLLEEKTLNYLVDHAKIIEVERSALSQNNKSDKENN